MILWLIIILMGFFICSMTLIKRRLLRWVTSLLVVGSLLVTICFLIAHMTSHLGMEVATNTQTQKIYSAASTKSPVNILVIKRLGTSAKRYVLIYRTHPTAKAKAHFIPDQKHVVIAIKKKAWYRRENVQQASVKTTTKNWRWRSKMIRFWFKIGTPETLISKKSVVIVPTQTWLVLTSGQTKQLAKIQRREGSHIVIELKAQLAQKIAAYQQQHPKTRPEQLKLYMQQQNVILTVQILRQILKQSN